MKDEINDMFKAANFSNGKRLFSYCIVCHAIKSNESNGRGPNLFGIVGAKQARKKNFNYSFALQKRKDKIWTVDELYLWLRDPQAYAPGTKMIFGGLADPQDRMDIIAYLMTLK